MQISDVVLNLAAGVGIDLAPDGKTAYYVEWSVGELAMVETQTGMVTTIRTGLKFPQDVEVDWTTGDIFVSERTGAILQVGPGERIKSVAKPGGAPHQLALVKQGGQRLLYSACYDSGQLVRVDLAAGTTTTVATGLGHPVGLVVDAAHKFAYVTVQDTASLMRVELATGVSTAIISGLVAPFFLAWDKNQKGIYCVQRDPANNLVRIELTPAVSMSVVAGGLAWRPSGVAPTPDDKLIYICSDRELEVISFNGAPTIRPGRPPFQVQACSSTSIGARISR